MHVHVLAGMPCSWSHKIQQMLAVCISCLQGCCRCLDMSRMYYVHMIVYKRLLPVMTICDHHLWQKDLPRASGSPPHNHRFKSHLEPTWILTVNPDDIWQLLINESRQTIWHETAIMFWRPWDTNMFECERHTKPFSTKHQDWISVADLRRPK